MSSEIVIRAALPRERRLLDKRLGALAQGKAAPRVFVASDRAGGGPPRGFGVFQPPEDASVDGGVGQVFVSVGPDHRCAGIGTALLHRLIEAARVMGLKKLDTLRPIDPQDPARSFLTGNGFESVTVICEFEAEPAAMLADVDRVHRRLVERGKIPSDAELVPIEKSPVSEVHALVLAYLPRLGDDLEPDLSSFTSAASRALLVGSELIGATLEKKVDDVARIYAIVVKAGKRNTWAGVHLKQALYSSLVAAGETKVRFRAGESIHKDTFKAAKRAKAEVLGTMEHFRLTLEDADEADEKQTSAGEPEV